MADGQKVVITSANAPHYIALDADDVSGWRWTTVFNSAHRFDSRDAAEAFALAFLPDLHARRDVWYLGHLW